MSGYDELPDYGGPTPTWRGIIVALAVVAALVALIFAYAARAQGLSGSVDRVVDGDTFWLCDAAACHKIRLCGIDAPERGEAGHKESGDALEKLVAGKRMHCVQVGNGTPCDSRSKAVSSDRVVAQCFVAGADLAGALITGGYACDWTKFTGGHYSIGGSGIACGRRR